MLIPDLIPESEPQINVGIILPEDNLNNLSLVFSDDSEYILILDENRLPIKLHDSLKVSLSSNNLIVEHKDGSTHTSQQIKIQIIKNQKNLSKNNGVKLSPVIAGRGFHWQKQIEVYLPDTIIIKVIDGRLVLINQLDLEHYVMCVATSEMNAECPTAMIEAQTIAARSWLLANIEQKHRSLEMDVCNDDCCQRYQGTTFLSDQSVAGAMNSYGQVLIYDQKICDARYSKSCGGMMESFETIWQGQKIEYLKNKVDSYQAIEIAKSLEKDEYFSKWVDQYPPAFCSSKSVSEKTLKKYLGSVDEEGHYFRWTIELEQKAILDALIFYAQINAKAISSFKALSRGGSGRINKLQVTYITHNNKSAHYIISSEYNVRRYLSKKFLFSSAFIINEKNIVDSIPQFFELKGAGWGHGVGLCQIGALGMSLSGYQKEEILGHYYPGSILKKIY